MTREICKTCKFGSDEKPGGKRPSPGTVWCLKRGMQMGTTRELPCFTSVRGRKSGRCFECKHAKFVKPYGGVPAPGNIYCDKLHKEINKLRSTGCFERG